MSKSKFHRYYKSYVSFAVIEALLFMVILSSCAQVHHRNNESHPSDAETASDSTVLKTAVDSGMAFFDADQADGNNTADLNENTSVPPEYSSGLGIPAPKPVEPPEAVLVAMDTLKEPDFTQPLESLATDQCGYIFRAESTTDWSNVFNGFSPAPIEMTTTTIETRRFDKAGRLIAAEIEVDPTVFQILNYPLHSTRRFQIDYDQNGRPMRVRISPAYYTSDAYTETTENRGSVIRIEYRNDGSIRSFYVTDEIELVASGFTEHSFSDTTPPEGWFFCDWLRFDSHGNLLDRKWDCNNPTTVQTRTYDDQHRLLSDHGFYLYDPARYQAVPIGWTDFLHKGEWKIDSYYDDAEHRETIVWMGHEDGSIIGASWTFSGMPLSSEPVEHRLVHTYDESGERLIRSEYDQENDGTFDELVSYTYQDGQLLSKAFDFWIDGIVDMMELHTRSPNSHLIERRNMTQESDVVYSSQTVADTQFQSYVDSTAVLPAQSQSIIELKSDDQSRRVAIDLEAQWLYSRRNSQDEQLVVVSESWHETSVYADEGYVREKQIVWQPSDEWVNVQEQNQTVNPSGGAEPYIFNATHQSTTCTLTPICEDGEVVLPEDDRLLTCEAGAVFPQYRINSRMPSVEQNDVFTLPPYDAVPGIQKALKRYLSSYAFPRAPYVRDIVGY